MLTALIAIGAVEIRQRDGAAGAVLDKISEGRR
jgi:hypothetical protein